MTIRGVICILFIYVSYYNLVISTQTRKENTRTFIEKGLSKAFDVFSNWCNENNMIVNLETTATQFFLLTQQSFRPDLKYGRNIIANTGFYLFGYNGSYKTYLTISISEQFSKRLNIQKCLAGATWGSTRSMLNIAYKTFVLSPLMHCCEPFIIVSNPLLKELETLDNRTLRLIIGAVKSTPIDTMLFLI